MKRLTLTVIVSSLVLLIACAPASAPESSPSTVVPTLKKITLDDATDILNVSLLLPSRFEQLDAASEGMSNEDLGLGPDFSEVQLFFSEDPFQMIWCALGIEESRIERAAFDRAMEDKYQIEVMLETVLQEAAAEEGFEITLPTFEITYPDIGDSAMLGKGYIETYGFHYGFDTLWLRSNTVLVFLYSMYMSSDNQPLLPIAREIENRLENYRH